MDSKNSDSKFASIKNFFFWSFSGLGILAISLVINYWSTITKFFEPEDEIKKAFTVLFESDWSSPPHTRNLEYPCHFLQGTWELTDTYALPLLERAVELVDIGMFKINRVLNLK